MIQSTLDKRILFSLQAVLILLAATFFTVFCFQHLQDPGDQEWFRQMAEIFDYRYLTFALHRYQTWSSRLLIEAATAFLAYIPLYSLEWFG